MRAEGLHTQSLCVSDAPLPHICALTPQLADLSMDRAGFADALSRNPTASFASCRPRGSHSGRRQLFCGLWCPPWMCCLRFYLLMNFFENFLTFWRMKMVQAPFEHVLP